MKTPAFFLAIVGLASATPGSPADTAFSSSSDTSFFIESDTAAEPDATPTDSLDVSGTTGFSKSVTVTSDAKRTIKKTVIVRDGRREEYTEVTDENGKVTRTGPANAAKEEPGERNEGDADATRAWMGLKVSEASAVLRNQLDLAKDVGVFDAVAPDGPAEMAGLAAGDLITRGANDGVGTPVELSRAMDDHQAGDRVTVSFLRRGGERTATVVLAEPPADAEGRPGRAVGNDRAGDAGVRLQFDLREGAMEEITDDPNVPDSFKQQLRKMQERMREFDRRHEAEDR